MPCAVLVALVRMTHRLAALPANSPVMKLLTGAEFLLQKGEEWDQSAPRSMSVAAAMSPLSQLIARWRRMELHSWPKALNVKEDGFRNKALRGLFHLYGLIHSGPQDLDNFFPREKLLIGEACALFTCLSAITPANSSCAQCTKAICVRSTRRWMSSSITPTWASCRRA